MTSFARQAGIALLLLLWPAFSGLRASECRDYSMYPHWVSQAVPGTWAPDVLLDGDLAYLSLRTAGVAVIDISDPWHPMEKGRVSGWSGTADALALSGSHLFVSDGTGRTIHVLDVSDPTEPVELTRFDTGIYPDGLAMAGSTLFCAVQYDGVAMFDISDVASIESLGVLPAPLAHNVRAFGNLLFVTGYEGDLWTYGLVETGAPTFLSHLDFPDEIETYDVAQVGDLVYVTGALGGHIVDVSIPTDPAVVGSFAPGSQTITIADQRAYLNPYNLSVLDLTDPLDPVPVFGLPTPSQPGAPSILKTVVAGGFAFSATRNSGLVIAELASQEAPQISARYTLPVSSQRVQIWNGLALVADQSAGLLLIDIADPENLELVATVASENAHDVVTAGPLAYLADGGDGLKIIDLSIPAEPQLIGHKDTYSRLAMGLVLDNEIIYMAADLNGLMVIDVSDPTQPVLLSQLATASRAQDVCYSGGYAFVADKEGGLQVIDVSNPHSPFVAGTLDLPGYQECVILDGTTLYIGGRFTELRAVDISNPTEPEILGWLPVEARGLALDGDFLLAAGRQGVTLVDRSDPMALKSVGFLPPGEDCSGVAATEGLILASGDFLSLAPGPCPLLSPVEGVPSGMSAWAQLSAAPNPFNPRIEIEFELKQPQQVQLEVYDLAGTWVSTLASEQFSASRHRLMWDGRDFQGRPVSAGCYFVLLSGERESQSLKIMLIR